jgi:hypothetical protein
MKNFDNIDISLNTMLFITIAINSSISENYLKIDEFLKIFNAEQASYQIH